MTGGDRVFPSLKAATGVSPRTRDAAKFRVIFKTNGEPDGIDP
jgi:hypothetical protein